MEGYLEKFLKDFDIKSLIGIKGLKLNSKITVEIGIVYSEITSSNLNYSLLHL